LPAGAVGQPYRAQFYARGGLAPFRWKASGSLPPGLSLGSDGAISGTPTGPGSFGWTVEVSDSSSKTARKRINLRIDDLSQPVAFAPNPKVMLQPKTPRIGLNVGDSFTYYDDAHLYNQYIINPGMEPNPPSRKMYWAWAGTPKTLEEHYYAQFQELGELNSGFWDGGHYWILSGPAKGREGTIVKYQRVPDKKVEGGFRAVWTLADSAPSRAPGKTPAKEMDKDIVRVESLPANKTDPQSYKGALPPGWWAVADESATFSVDKDNRTGGSQSAKVVSGKDAKVGFLSALVTDN